METKTILSTSSLATTKPKFIETLSGNHLAVTDFPLYNLHMIKTVTMYDHIRNKWIKFKILHKK